MTIFQDLDEDIVLVVLTKCDVYTVNRQIRTLALSKRVWLAMVANLITSCFIDSLSDPNFYNYSAAELREMVKRVVCGPSPWANTPGTGCTPLANRKISVQSPCITAGPDNRSTYVKLLPGGRFFTLENYNGKLECWSIESGRCIWSYSEKRRTTYAVDLLNDGYLARFLLPGSSERTFTIAEVDLGTGIAKEVFQTRSETETGGRWTVRDAAISGDYLTLTVHIDDSWAVLLINWKERIYLLFHQSSTVPCVALIPGHIILGSETVEPPHRPALIVYTLAALKPHWRPLTTCLHLDGHDSFDLHRIQQGYGLPPTLVEYPGVREGWEITPGPAGECGMQLLTRESPLRRGSYVLAFVVSEHGAFPGPNNYPDTTRGRGAILVRYCVSIPGPPSRLRLRQTSAVPIAACRARDMSYALYSSMIEGVEDMDLLRRQGRRWLVRRGNHDSMHLSPYSSAVTALAGSKVTVSYYL
ncbi:hypothetical protein C8R47DRAFT_1204990 [Mycena vitilis]|nr:hypothetical protein C8R47DRAFT_1204990 [Mycena vitilis]